MKEQDVFPNRKTRTTYEQLSVILESCKEPQIISKLFYTLQTSYPMFKKILKEATRLKLLRKTRKGYRLTLKGSEYLTKWEGFLKFLGEKKEAQKK